MSTFAGLLPAFSPFQSQPPCPTPPQDRLISLSPGCYFVQPTVKGLLIVNQPVQRLTLCRLRGRSLAPGELGIRDSFRRLLLHTRTSGIERFVVLEVRRCLGCTPSLKLHSPHPPIPNPTPS